MIYFSKIKLVLKNSIPLFPSSFISTVHISLCPLETPKSHEPFHKQDGLCKD